jgi:hypothetical protein
MSSPVSATVTFSVAGRGFSVVSLPSTTCISSLDLNEPVDESFCFRDSIEIARRERYPRADSGFLFRPTNSRAASSSSEGSLFSVDLMSRDSLEFARQAIAQRRARAVLKASILTNASSTVKRPWAIQIPYQDSLDLSREQHAHTTVAARCVRANKLPARVRAKMRSLADDCGAVLLRAKRVCLHQRHMPESDLSVRGREIKVRFETGRKMRSKDYDAYERRMTRVKALERGAGRAA